MKACSDWWWNWIHVYRELSLYLDSRVEQSIHFCRINLALVVLAGFWMTINCPLAPMAPQWWTLVVTMVPVLLGCSVDPIQVVGFIPPTTWGTGSIPETSLPYPPPPMRPSHPLLLSRTAEVGPNRPWLSPFPKQIWTLWTVSAFISRLSRRINNNNRLSISSPRVPCIQVHCQL